jgi:hypothetical protein
MFMATFGYCGKVNLPGDWMILGIQSPEVVVRRDIWDDAVEREIDFFRKTWRQTDEGQRGLPFPSNAMLREWAEERLMDGEWTWDHIGRDGYFRYDDVEG